MSTPPFVRHAVAARPARVIDFAGIPPARRSPPRTVAVRRPPLAPGFGVPCPDAGYALLLAHVRAAHLALEPRERRDDAVWAIATIAMLRAGVLGRAPFIGDVSAAETLLAYDGDAPADFTLWRARQLDGIAHDADLRQRLADAAMMAVDWREAIDADVARTWRVALRERF